MIYETTPINDVYIINSYNSIDQRGKFVKTYNKNFFIKNKFDIDIRESYYSLSNNNVIRGLHFQLPPHDHHKLVYVCSGSIIDVIIDLRQESSTFKKIFSVKLTSKNNKSILIPKGIAHGFRSLEDNTITVYNVTSEYNSENDSGILYDSFGFDWRINKPIISERDMSFESLNSFLLKKIF